MNKKITFIKNGVCPTCGAPISDEHLQEYEDAKLKLGEEYTKNEELVDVLNMSIIFALLEFDLFDGGESDEQ